MLYISFNFIGGGTNTEAALNLAAARMFNKGYGARDGVKKVATKTVLFSISNRKNNKRKVDGS